MNDKTPYVWTLADAEAIGRFIANVECTLKLINVSLMILAACAFIATSWLLLAPRPAHAGEIDVTSIYTPNNGEPVITNCAGIYLSPNTGEESSYFDSVADRALRGERTVFFADTLMNYMDGLYPGFRYEWPMKQCAYKCFFMMPARNLCMDEYGNWSRPRPEAMQ